MTLPPAGGQPVCATTPTGFFSASKFGARRVQKVSLDAGFTCPNVDGTVATGGCTFCDNRSFSPSRRPLNRSARRHAQHILDQLDDGIRRLKHRYEVDRFHCLFSAGDEYLRAGRSAAAAL